MSLDFDGIDDRIHLPTPSGLLRNVGAWTLMAWIRADTLVGNPRIITIAVGPPPGISTSSRATLEIKPAGTLSIGSRRLDTDAAIDLDSVAGTITTGTIFHVAGTCVYGATRDSKLYKNGVQIASSSPVSIAGNTSNTDSKNGAIAANDNGLSGFFDGQFEDIRVYGRALSPDEIATIFAAQGTDGIVDGLQARYLLDEASPGTTASVGATVKDISNNKFNGTPGAGVAAPIYREMLRVRKRRSGY